MFNLERKFTSAEFEDLKYTLKSILSNKVNEENVLLWVDNFLTQYDGDISFGVRRWVGVKLLYCTTTEMIKSLGYKSILGEVINEYGDDYSFWIKTDSHRCAEIRKLGDLTLFWKNYDYKHTSIIQRLWNEKQLREIDNEKRLAEEFEKEVIEKYVS